MEVKKKINETKIFTQNATTLIHQQQQKIQNLYWTMTKNAFDCDSDSHWERRVYHLLYVLLWVRNFNNWIQSFVYFLFNKIVFFFLFFLFKCFHIRIKSLILRTDSYVKIQTFFYKFWLCVLILPLWGLFSLFFACIAFVLRLSLNWKQHNNSFKVFFFRIFCFLL